VLADTLVVQASATRSGRGAAGAVQADPTATTAASGGSHHVATATVCSSHVTSSAAATVAATVQSSPTTKPYQNRPKPFRQRRSIVICSPPGQ
jgi:hypothetical protein